MYLLVSLANSLLSDHIFTISITIYTSTPTADPILHSSLQGVTTATLAQLQASKWKFRKQQFLCIYLHYPPTTSNPCCAQFHIWQSGACKQRRQLKYIHYMTQHIIHAVKESKHSLKHQCSPSPHPTATLHVAPLCQYSIHNWHLIACTLKTQLKYCCRFNQPPGHHSLYS